jgi:hypothetical protein
VRGEGGANGCGIAAVGGVCDVGTSGCSIGVCEGDAQR